MSRSRDVAQILGKTDAVNEDNHALLNTSSGVDSAEVVTLITAHSSNLDSADMQTISEQVSRNKNLLINGSMNVAQRTSSATGVGGSTGGTYNAQDRWNFFAYGSPAARWTQSVSTDVPASSTFTTSLKLDCTTASGTVGAAHRQQLMQVIEAQDLQHLRYGSAAAKKVTLSFWVKSSVTGKNYCWIYHHDGTRFTYKSYTVNSADTWEHKTLTFTGDTASAITNDNGGGLNIIWMLYAGTDYTGATDGVEDTWAAWNSGNYDQFNGQVNNASSTDNNWYLTGAQLQVGDTATAFEHEDYVITLNKCLRYFYKLRKTNAWGEFVTIRTYSSDDGTGIIYFPQPMRAQPTLTIDKTVNSTNFAYSLNSIAVAASDVNVTQVGIACASSSASAFVTGGGATIQSNGASGAIDVSFDFSAEL